MAMASVSTIERIDLMLEKLWEELDDEIRNSKSGIVSDRYSTNIQEYKTMTFIAIGTLAATHSVVSNLQYLLTILTLEDVFKRNGFDNTLIYLKLIFTEFGSRASRPHQLEANKRYFSINWNTIICIFIFEWSI